MKTGLNELQGEIGLVVCRLWVIWERFFPSEASINPRRYMPLWFICVPPFSQGKEDVARGFLECPHAIVVLRQQLSAKKIWYTETLCIFFPLSLSSLHPVNWVSPRHCSQGLITVHKVMGEDGCKTMRCSHLWGGKAWGTSKSFVLHDVTCCYITNILVTSQEYLSNLGGDVRTWG